ncbi:11543_t:CDS:2, partial [Funneliformis geosporum]
EQVRKIHSDIEELLTRKIKANTASDGSSILSRLDGFEMQLEEREALLKQKKNNIKKTIEDRIAEEHKYLKDDYDD